MVTLRSAEKVVILTGAGISAESGVPTFREAQTGLWARYDPQELATPEAFLRNPRLVWEWYAWRRELISQVQPNPGHFALADMEHHIPELVLLTQNVDGLHQQAGSRAVIELHGNIMRTRCFKEDTVIETWPGTENIPPLCPRCGSMLRPDVVWFGENLSAYALLAAQEAAGTCDLFFSVGTSGVVEPAASLPFIAQRQGAVILEVNPSSTPLTGYANHLFQEPSGQFLPALVQAVWG